MIKKITLSLAAFMSLFALMPSLALANTPGDSIICGVNGAAGKDCTAKPPDPGSLDKTITNILNILSSLVGVAAVIMIIYSGLRYIVSGGDAEKVKTAKKALLYAIIGLLIVALTQTIVHFVLTEAKTPT